MIPAIVTQGFGSFGSIPLIVTQGFAIGAAAEPGGPLKGQGRISVPIGIGL